MKKILIRAIDSKTKKSWEGATYLEAIFAFYNNNQLTLEVYKDGEWQPCEIEYKELVK